MRFWACEFKSPLPLLVHLLHTSGQHLHSYYISTWMEEWISPWKLAWRKEGATWATQVKSTTVYPGLGLNLRPEALSPPAIAPQYTPNLQEWHSTRQPFCQKWNDLKGEQGWYLLYKWQVLQHEAQTGIQQCSSAQTHLKPKKWFFSWRLASHFRRRQSLQLLQLILEI